MGFNKAGILLQPDLIQAEFTVSMTTIHDGVESLWLKKKELRLSPSPISEL